MAILSRTFSVPRSIVLCALGVALSTACTTGTIGESSAPLDSTSQLVRDEAAGISFTVPSTWRSTSDAVLFKDSYGVFVSGEDRDPSTEGPHDREPIARIAWRYAASPGDIETLVRAHLNDPSEETPQRADVQVDGLRGVVVTGLAGSEPYSVVYVAAEDRVYEIGLWTHSRGLDDRAREVLASIRFAKPTRSLESLGLQHEDDSLHWQPTGEISARNAAAFAARLTDLTDDGPDPEKDAPPAPPAEELGERASALSCGILAPYGTDMEWQTQWDASANYYGYAGWTRMSGNGGSWWGEGFHVSCADSYYHNQQYANDWPLQFGANVYSHFSGYVKYAGWARGGHYTLGRIVIVRNGRWSSLSAHLNGFGAGIAAGVWINAPKTVIGYAGNSDGGAGYGWAPHLHSRVTSGETYNGYGMPIGGYAVMPRAFRCYGCTDFDEKTPDGRKWYTQFYKNRWMKY